MAMTDLNAAFIDELKDVYSAEKQLTRALPKLAKKASDAELKNAFKDHLEETKGHVERVEKVFASIGKKATAKKCEAMAGIVEEGEGVMSEDAEPEVMDAMLIAAGQKAEHYEIATYGTLVAWAKALGHKEAADLLNQNEKEEGAADKKLTALAKRINKAAMAGAR